MQCKKLRVVLSVGEVEVIAFAKDREAALAAAINLLSMQTELRPGWTLRVEVEGDTVTHLRRSL
jgi:hypothetical protein